MWKPARPLVLAAACWIDASAAAASPGDDGPGSSPGVEGKDGSANPETTAPNAQGPGRAATSSADERRDPSGRKGLSPYAEALVAGDVAYAQQDYRTAAARFGRAVALDPGNPAPRLRLGWAQLRNGDTDGAEQSWQEAARLASKENRLKARALWVLADLRERRGKPIEAVEAYRAYASFVAAHPDSRGDGGNAESRIERIEQYQKLVESYAAVEARMLQRAREGAERLRKSSE